MASFTLRGALIHLHFSSLPIDLWIMVLEPGVAKDHALLPKVGDGKERSFRVGFITENYIYHFGDLPCFIRGAIHVEHWYGSRDVPDANTLRSVDLDPLWSMQKTQRETRPPSGFVRLNMRQGINSL